ncbi:MAG: hypothetical protein AB1861_18075 [Cyanobacteriota bacterium]
MSRWLKALRIKGFRFIQQALSRIATLPYHYNNLIQANHPTSSLFINCTSAKVLHLALQLFDLKIIRV